MRLNTAKKRTNEITNRPIILTQMIQKEKRTKKKNQKSIMRYRII